LMRAEVYFIDSYWRINIVASCLLWLIILSTRIRLHFIKGCTIVVNNRNAFLINIFFK